MPFFSDCFGPYQMSQYSMCVGCDSPWTLCLARWIFHQSGNALLLSSVQSSLELSSHVIIIYYINTLCIRLYRITYIFLQLTLGSGMENWRLTGYTYVPYIRTTVHPAVCPPSMHLIALLALLLRLCLTPLHSYTCCSNNALTRSACICMHSFVKCSRCCTSACMCIWWWLVLTASMCRATLSSYCRQVDRTSQWPRFNKKLTT